MEYVLLVEKPSPPAITKNERRGRMSHFFTSMTASPGKNRLLDVAPLNGAARRGAAS